MWPWKQVVTPVERAADTLLWNTTVKKSVVPFATTSALPTEVIKSVPR
jgi:hypothetical protein